MDIGTAIVALFFPMIVWIGIVAAIVAVVRGNFATYSKGKPAGRQPVGRTVPYGSRRVSDYPRPQKGIFDMKPTRPKSKSAFSKRDNDFDTYTARGRKKDFVGGYDKKFTNGQSYRRARGMQFSHTYNGHEPWDKCLPKEKDPWDKDFYV